MFEDRSEASINQDKFLKLKTLITERQEFERNHFYPPYNQHKTDINFTDIHGNSLLHYAAEIGDINIVKNCLSNNADINLRNKFSNRAIDIALEKGHFDMVKFLFEQGANCSNLHLTACAKNAELTEWLTNKIYQALHESNLHGDINQFCSRSSHNSYLHRAAEIGEIKFINDFITDNEHQISDNDINLLLIIAAKNGRLDLVKFLVEHNANINNNYVYSDTALIQSILNNKHDIINYLIEQKAIDVNKQDQYKNTALMYAVDMENESLISTLIKKGADINQVNINGNTLLHMAITNNNPSLIKKLLEYQGVKDLSKIKNIYGKTPLDLAIQNKQDEIIQLLDPYSNLELIKNSSAYGVKPIDISQDNINEKIFYRLKINYRDTDYFSTEGACNGYSFLKSYYASKNMEQYYFNTLALMATWDGNKESLGHQLNDIPQSHYYKNLDDLFEQWTNDIIWFQHIDSLKNITQINQEDRLKQYSMIKSKESKDYEPYVIYTELNTFRTTLQLEEIMMYLMKMPTNVRFEFTGGQHATSGYKNNDNNFVYYDCNMKFKTEVAENLKENIQRIIDYKYIYLSKYIGNRMNCPLMVYYYKNDLLLNNQNQFEVFKDTELPKSKGDTAKFQLDSPNQFTPLHIAAITRSLPTLKKLLADNYCDLNAKDVYERDVLMISVENHFWDAVEQLLKHKEIFLPSNIEPLIKQAYQDNQMKIVNSIIETIKPPRNMPDLFIEAVKNKDITFINFLLKSHMVDLYTQPYSPLAFAFSNDPYNSHVNSPVDAILSHLKNSNQLDSMDSNGHAAIHLAAKLANVEAIKKLLKIGADVKLLTTGGQSVFSILAPNYKIFGEENTNIEKIKCLKLLIENCDFSLTNHNDRNLLIELLTKYATHKDEELFKLILNKCDSEIINSVSVDNQKLLHHFMLNKEFINRIKPILDKGANIDVKFASGNTPLMGLINIDAQNYPEKYDLISLFIKYNPDLTIENNNKTVIELARDSNDDKIKTIFDENDLLAKKDSSKFGIFALKTIKIDSHLTSLKSKNADEIMPRQPKEQNVTQEKKCTTATDSEVQDTNRFNTTRRS